MKVTLSSAILDDHIGRLYDSSFGPTKGGSYVHVDEIDMPDEKIEKLITIEKSGKRTATIDITIGALLEFIDDMEYQVECCEDEDQRAYVGACRRALAQLRKAVA